MTNHQFGSSQPFSVCQNILPNISMRSDFDLLSQAGVNAVALTADMVLKTGLSKTVSMLGAYRLSVSTFISGLRVLNGSREDFDNALQSRLHAAANLRATSILLTTGPITDLSVQHADDEVALRLTRASARAEELGIRVGIEPVNPFLRTVSYVHTLSHATELVRRVPSSSVIFDTAHAYWDRHVYDDIVASAHLISSVQLSNLSSQGIEARRWQRSSFDEGVVPVKPLIRCLHSAGFRGFYENEIKSSAEPTQCLSDIRSSRLWFEGVFAELAS